MWKSRRFFATHNYFEKIQLLVNSSSIVVLFRFKINIPIICFLSTNISVWVESLFTVQGWNGMEQ